MSINAKGQPWPQTLAHDDLEWPASDQRVLVPFHEAVNLEATGRLGGSVAFGSDGDLYLLYALDAEGIDHSASDRERAGLKATLREEFDVPVVDRVEKYSPQVLDSFVQSHAITTAVVDDAEASFFSRGRPPEQVASGCHTVVGTRMDEFESPSGILVPVARGPHSGLATKVANAIARSFGCWIELFHVVPEDASDDEVADAERLLEAYEYRLEDGVDRDHHVYRAADAAEAIVEHAQYHSLTVLGAPRKGKLRRFLFGSTTDDVRDNVAHGPVLTAHRNGADSVLSRWI